MTHINDFFMKKKEWSILKDRIIDHYLKPYTTKILFTGKPLHLIDCFAGRGKFNDGSDGSPLIIAKHIKSMLEDAYIQNKIITGHFVEKTYHENLSENLIGYSNCEVLPGSFEENLPTILKIPSSDNVFVYIDPFGIKNLDFNNFQLVKENNFHSLELLMNFNSFGFLREGCRLKKYEKICDEEQDDDYGIDEPNTIDNMNHVANGDYWQGILNKYNEDRISFSDAEEFFVVRYTEQLGRLFRHVVNIPIKLKTRNIPKYRMIFCTDHADGLILMADEMNKVWKSIVEQERRGQGVLFEFDFPSTMADGINLEGNISRVIGSGRGGNISLKQLFVQLIEHYGISYSLREYKEKLREMENKQVRILRTPEYTPTGKKATSMDYNSNRYSIRLKLI
jgi:three-Cys-motif partner protein